MSQAGAEGMRHIAFYSPFLKASMISCQCISMLQIPSDDSSADEAADMSSSKRPLFVIGSLRSGTTLVRYLLDTHDRLACPPETKFIAALDAFLDYPQVRQALLSLGFTAADIHRKVRSFIESFLQDYATRTGKQRWVDKTPNYYRILNFIEEIFESQPFYLFVVRYPLDTICSLENYVTVRSGHEDPDVARMVSQHGKGRYAWAQYWLEVYERIYCFASSHTDRCYILKYEDLVTNTNTKINEIVGFFGEDPSLLHLDKAFTMSHTQGFQDYTILKTSRVHADSVGQWKRWPLPEAQAIWGVVEETARKFSYAQPAA
jgi:protein-tyrosine sulfotransferase